MNIISFAYTMPALLAGLKGVTRRDWPDKYAAQFHPRDLVQAYNKNARNGGKCGAIIQLEDLYREPLERMIEDPAYGQAELIKEGNLWPSVEAFIVTNFAKLRHGHPWRIQFHLHDIAGKQMALPLLDPVPGVHAEFCRLTKSQIPLSIFQRRWSDLLALGFTPDDVALVTRYLLRETKAGRRKESCLKIQWFTVPENFASDLPLAKKAFPPRAPSAAPVQPETITPISSEAGPKIAAGLAAFRRSLRCGKPGA